MNVEVFLRLPTLAAAFVCRHFRRSQRGDVPDNVLVVRLDGIGDGVMTLALLEQLRQLFPQARITVAVQPSSAPLFAESEFVDEILVLRRPRILTGTKGFSHPKLALFVNFCSTAVFYWGTLRKRFFDIAISPRWDGDMCLATCLCALTRAPITVGYEDATTPAKFKVNRGFQRAFSHVLQAGPSQHEVLRNLAIGRELGSEDSHFRPRLTLSPERRQIAKATLGAKKESVCVALGLPAAAPHRRWDAEHYAAVIGLLGNKLAVTPVIFADKATLEIAAAIKEEFPESHLAAGLPLIEVAALIAECDVFLGSDSGLAHIAAAVDCKTIVLSPHPRGADPDHFNSPIRFRPYGAISEVLQPAGCRIGCEAGCGGDKPHCILDIEPAEVSEAILGMLRSDGRE